MEVAAKLKQRKKDLNHYAEFFEFLDGVLFLKLLALGLQVPDGRGEGLAPMLCRNQITRGSFLLPAAELEKMRKCYT